MYGDHEFPELAEPIQVERSSERAYMVTTSDGSTRWIPKSQCEELDGYITHLAKWLGEKIHEETGDESFAEFI